MNKEQFENELDGLLRLAQQATRRGMDAAGCGTAHDRRRARDAEECFDDARDAFLARWGGRP